MVVDELLIPDRAGTIRLSLDARITVFAGVSGPARARLVDLLVGTLAGRGPGCARLRDGLGREVLISALGARLADGRLSPGPVPGVAPDEAALRRMLVVAPRDLGLDPEAPAPLVVAERTALAAAHRQLVDELAAIEAGATEAERLRGELAVLAPDDGPALAVDDDVALELDELLGRRAEAAAALARLDAASRDEVPAADVRPDDAGTGVLAARAVLRRIAAMREALLGPRDDGPLGSALDREEATARAELAEATAHLDVRREEAALAVAALDDELADRAGALGLAVDPEGAAVAVARAVGRLAPDGGSADPLADHRADLEARIAELPSAEDVRAARRRVQIAARHLARLGGEEPPPERVRNVLLGRIAALRPHGTEAVLPLVLDDPLVGLDPGTRCDLLDVVARVAERAQVLVLTDDPVVTSWARHRAERGEVGLVELAPTGAPAAA